MKKLTPEDVRSHLGDVDDLVVSEIIASGASVEDVAEAVAAIKGDEELDLQSPITGSAALARVQGLIRDAQAAKTLDEDRQEG